MSRVLAAAVLLCAVGGLRCNAPPPPPPDVLVLVMDTTRADRCSFLGYGSPTTPRLEEFAKDSVVFANAWSPASWTFAAHAALFTGELPERMGLVRSWPPVLPKEETTLAELLHDEGWATGCFTCNAWIAPHSGLSQGFEEVQGVYLPHVQESAAEAHRRALAWMGARRREGRPFFAFVNDIEPHAPYDPPRQFGERFVAKDTKSELIFAATALRYPVSLMDFLGKERIPDDTRAVASSLYDAEIATLDHEIGRLLDDMRASGLLDNTLVVITADHGEGLWQHGWMEHGTLLHRELLRVPLLVRPPGGVAPRRVEDVVRLQDVFPTVLASCRVKAPRTPDSAGLLGPTAGRVAIAAERTRRDVVEATAKVLTDADAKRLAALRRSYFDGRWHLLVDDAGGVELYDVNADPAESRNVASALPGVVAELRRRLDAGVNPK